MEKTFLLAMLLVHALFVSSAQAASPLNSGLYRPLGGDLARDVQIESATTSSVRVTFPHSFFGVEKPQDFVCKSSRCVSRQDKRLRLTILAKNAFKLNDVTYVDDSFKGFEDARAELKGTCSAKTLSGVWEVYYAGSAYDNSPWRNYEIGRVMEFTQTSKNDFDLRIYDDQGKPKKYRFRMEGMQTVRKKRDDWTACRVLQPANGSPLTLSINKTTGEIALSEFDNTNYYLRKLALENQDPSNVQTSSLFETYREPNGTVWGVLRGTDFDSPPTPVAGKSTDDLSLRMSSLCKGRGARLPTASDFRRLMEHFGAVDLMQKSPRDAQEHEWFVYYDTKAAFRFSYREEGKLRDAFRDLFGFDSSYNGDSFILANGLIAQPQWMNIPPREMTPIFFISDGRGSTNLAILPACIKD